MAIAGNNTAEIANNLARKLSSLVPRNDVLELTTPVQPSAAVQEALRRSQVLAARAIKRSQSRSMVRTVVESFVRASSFIPYALVALALRFVLARVFFLYGQNLVSGPRVPLTVQDFEFTVTLPLEVKAQTFSQFGTMLFGLPVPPVLAAYAVSYAEFVLPIFLLLGLATRFSALALLIMTGVIALVMPSAIWTAHVYWAGMLLVLLSLGPGAISVDHVIRWIARR